MPPRVKKANRQKPQGSFCKENRTEDEKENICSDKLVKRKKNDRSSVKLQLEKIKMEELEKIPLSPQEEKLKIKAAGFWSKKLRDLESKKDLANQEKCSLYEFNGTDDCGSYPKMKKSKQKAGVSKRKKIAAPKCNKLAPLHQKLIRNKIIKSDKKLKQIHRQSLFREQITLRKQREQLADSGKTFTFSAGMSSLGITSTPALNKDNLIGASNFLFLSPIIKEEAECCRTINECTPLKSKVADNPTANPGQEIPKAKTELKRISCRRVLRSGKVLDI